MSQRSTLKYLPGTEITHENAHVSQLHLYLLLYISRQGERTDVSGPFRILQFALELCDLEIKVTRLISIVHLLWVPVRRTHINQKDKTNTVQVYLQSMQHPRSRTGCRVSYLQPCSVTAWTLFFPHQSSSETTDHIKTMLLIGEQHKFFSHLPTSQKKNKKKPNSWIRKYISISLNFQSRFSTNCWARCRKEHYLHIYTQTKQLWSFQAQLVTKWQTVYVDVAKSGDDG